jgi:hypothetical protein
VSEKLSSCSLCGEEIYEADVRLMHRQVVGWEPARGRKGGGTNALKMRRETGAVSHARCVEEGVRKMKAGVPLQQKGLF